MISGSATSRRLTRQDWVDAAARYVGQVGIAGLRVDPLATELGATKGSFYWHFANRAELVDAILATWEVLATEQIMGAVESSPPPDRLAELARLSFGDPEGDRLEWPILAAADHPQVAPVVARVTKVRIDFVRRLLRSAGLPPKRAEARARIIYAAYVGNLQLAAVAGLDTLDARRRTAIIDEIVAMAGAR